MPSVGGVEQAPVPFLEQTKTVIVFANGAVVRLAEGVFPGQILIMKNLKTDREAACRVISSKSIGNVQGYVEVEFTHTTTGFWEGNAPAPKETVTEAQIVEATREASRDLPSASSKNHAGGEASEDDAMSKALADAFSSLISPATQKPATGSSTSAMRSSNTAGTSTPEAMRSPGLGAKIPSVPQAPSSANGRSSVLANAKPVAIGDLIGSAPSPNFPESEPTESTYKPPSAYRGIEPRKSSVQPDPPAMRAASRPVEHSVQAARAPERKAGGQWIWMLAGVVASAVLMVGGFFGYRWYVGGGAPVSPTQAEARASSSTSSPTPISTASGKTTSSTAAAANPAPLEPERVVVRATPPESKPASNPVNSKPTSEPPSGAETNSRAAKSEIQASPAPTAAPSRQTSVLTMKTKMATPKAPGNSARQASAGNLALPDFANSNSPNVASLPSNALGGSLSAPPGGRMANSSITQPKLISSVAPVYPQIATINGTEGDVRIDAMIGENGHVGTMKVLEGPMALRQAAMVAVSQWRYEPAKLDGKSISSHLVVLVQFRLKR